MLDTAQELYNAIPRPTVVEMTDVLAKGDGWSGGPSEATIRDWIRKGWITLDPRDGPWSLDLNTPAGEAALALRYLGLHAGAQQGPSAGLGPHRPRRRVVDWAVTLHEAFPELELAQLFHLAATAVRGGTDLERVEAFLAFTPWTDDGEALAQAYASGVVGFDVVALGGFDSSGYTRKAAMAQQRKQQEGASDER